MKIVIFGASGKTGALLTDKALAKGHIVTAFARRQGSILQQHPNLKVVVGNLTDESALKQAISGSDAVLSTLGGSSLTKHSSEIVDGVSRIISIMEQEKVSRFIYLSSIGAGESRYFMAPLIRFLVVDFMLRVPLADHTYNEQRISESSLNWTLVRPGGLTDGPYTGKLSYGSETIHLKGSRKISRANVASFMLQQLAETTFVKKGAWLYEQ
jgi:putative NADH-flavin reductase